MYNVISNNNNGTIVIYETFDVELPENTEGATPYLNNIGDQYIIHISNIENLSKLTKFTYDTLDLNEERYLLQYYRTSRNGTSWSDWFDLNINIENFPKIDPMNEFFMEVKWVRAGTSDIGSIRLLKYRFEGELERNEAALGQYSIQVTPFEKKIIRSPFLFKVFKITDFEVIPSQGELVKISYRYSQDHTKTWSDWEILTKENITTIRINPIRFFQIEYLIENNTTSPIYISDINLIGDFQNVNRDYQKSNLYGVRECCQSNNWGYYDADGNYHPNETLNTTGSTECSSNIFNPMSADDKANLYNPYAQTTATNLLEKLSADAEQIIGHKVTYFATDPDGKGIDYTLHEFQLYNIVCEGDLKISIDGNNFPDSQIKMNIFDLDLFETMEAHVTKQQFKQIFGLGRRPAKEDIIYFCNVNRMYQVEHAQQFRSFNNTSVYYKLILKKYNKKANVQSDISQIKTTLDTLTKNSTLDVLMGIEKAQDKAAIANKPQTQTLSKDPIRLEYFADIDKELIENSTNIISKSNYDLSSVAYGNPAIIYKNLDPVLKESDNLSLCIWFNIHNYLEDEIYYFMKLYDQNNSLGFYAYLSNDIITVKLNSDLYTYSLNEIQGDPNALDENVWYCYVLNINQRQRYIENYIYKRNVDSESDAEKLNSTILRKVYYNKQDIVPVNYRIEDPNVLPNIPASDMKITNIRMFIDVIPENAHNKLLNQYIIGDDSKYLIFADNATTRIFLPKFPLNGE